uniref:Uncharacterized protein n=1 Tax=Setaria digitata TaxID=48799 RepID=A0A915Q893_9BILA
MLLLVLFRLFSNPQINESKKNEIRPIVFYLVISVLLRMTQWGKSTKVAGKAVRRSDRQRKSPEPEKKQKRKEISRRKHKGVDTDETLVLREVDAFLLTSQHLIAFSLGIAIPRGSRYQNCTPMIDQLFIIFDTSDAVLLSQIPNTTGIITKYKQHSRLVAT